MVDDGTVSTGHITWSSTSVVLLAHGSQSTASGADRAREVADAVRAKGLFGYVEAAFLRDKPTPTDVLRAARTQQVFVVPFMVGEGYSIQRLIPNAVAAPETVTTSNIVLCRSVGVHPGIPAWAVDEVSRFCHTHAFANVETSILIAAHGTDRNPDNFDRAQLAVEAVKRTKAAATVDAVFLDQEPRVTQWRDYIATNSKTVIVMPFLMSLGRHARVDIPEALGIEGRAAARELTRGVIAGPYAVDGRNLFYGPLLGASPLLPEIVVERVREAMANLKAD